MRKLVAGVAGLLFSSAAVALSFRFTTVPATPVERAVQSRALALAWNGFATTTLGAAPLNGDHTLSVRFMAAYDASYRGVIVADESGSYHLGMAPYASLGRPALEVCVGGTTFTYPLPDAVLTDNDFTAGPPQQPRRRWRQLELTRRGATVVVAYDGNVVGTFEAGRQPATGTLRLGRLAKPSLGAEDQFYGLVDDVALSRPGVDGSARLDFDAPSNPGAASFFLGGSALLVPVSPEHRAELDEPRLPLAQHQTRLELPFLPGQVWMPIQGINSALSHHDVAVFAIDFIRVDPSFVMDNPRRVPGGSHDASLGQPILAAAPGRVEALVDTHDNDERSSTGTPLSNFVCVEHEAHEVSCVLHLLAGARARELARVAQGEAVARVGRTGAATVHLHFALSNRPESKDPDANSALVTMPAAFSDYFASSDFGQTWHHVERGVPAPGEWVRR